MAGTVTSTNRWARGQSAKIETLSYVCDAADGSAPDTSTNEVNGYVTRVGFKPGVPAPDGAFNITLYDSDGVDISGVNLHGLNGAASSGWIPDVTIFVAGPITAKLASQSTNSAQFDIHIYITT